VGSGGSGESLDLRFKKKVGAKAINKGTGLRLRMRQFRAGVVRSTDF
jgi:hypothetical protein